ncbi:MAG: helix-turn-helix domain-containing protein [Bacteroidota bacterium]
METLSRNLRRRAKDLGLSDAEVARRAGLSERRYGHYVTGTREPDFATFLRICEVLAVTPNDLLSEQTSDQPGCREITTMQAVAALSALDEERLSLAVKLLNVLADER